MTTWKEDRIAAGWKKRIPPRKKGVMSRKEERKFFGHNFEVTPQKRVFKAVINKELYIFETDKNLQICNIYCTKDVPALQEAAKFSLSQYRGIPVSLILNTK